MASMEHPNIVGFKALIKDPYCLVVEFCDLGSLYEVIHDTRFLSLLFISHSLSLSLSFLHLINKNTVESLIGIYEKNLRSIWHVEWNIYMPLVLFIET